MKDVLFSIFGQYEPVTTMVELSTGEIVQVVASGSAGVDWPYLAGVVLFGVVLYSFLRMVGMALK